MPAPAPHPDADAAAPSPDAASRDIITDFINGTDRIDLSAIDANSTTIGNNAFTFIGTGAFAGGGAADFQIQLTGNHTMTAADLML